MLNLPKIQEDELLEGYVLRVHDNSMNRLVSNTFIELFKQRNVNIDPYIPNNLYEVCRQLFSNKNAEEVILNYTLFSYYTAFYHNDTKNIYMEKMLRPKELVYSLKKNKEIDVAEHFRYCPECMREELKQVGYVFWNRIHQIVPVCTKHGIWIEESMIPTRIKLSNYIPSFTVLPEVEACQRRICSDFMMIEISQRMEQLMKKPVPVSEKVLKTVYRERVKTLGIASKTAKSVKSRELRDRLLEYFTEQRLAVLNVEAKHMRWAYELLGNYRTGIHPLYHILMQLFLKIDPYQLSDKCIEIIPWVECRCLNPLSSHYKQHKIDNVEVHYSYQGKCYMCTCFCSCGFKFTTRLDSFNESGGLKIGKVQKYGQEYMEHLLQLRFLGIKGIARLTGLGVQVVRAQLRRYDATGSIECGQKASNKHDIYGEDSTKRGKPRKRVEKNSEWSKKDESYCKLAKEIVRNELEKIDVKPIRLTRTRFAKEIGNLNAIIYCYDKLPQTNKIIEEYIESKEEYKVRRIKWGINRLRETGGEIKSWKIIRIVRNDNWCKEEVDEVIERLIDK